MASRKLKLTGLHQADSKGQEFLLAFSRPLSILEVQGVENAIRVVLESNRP